jgi:hypothetical protein
MTANRRAELQRKLAMKPVEKPPAGLASRIKNDIPKELRFNAEAERKRFAQSIRISLAAAASVIVVIATAYLGLHVTSKETATRTQAATPVAAVQPQSIPQAPVAAPKVAEEPQKDLKVVEHRARKRQVPAQTAVAAAPPPSPAGEAPSFAKEVAAADEAQNVAAQKSVAAPAAAAAPVVQNEPKSEATRSPISGKLMVVRGAAVMDAVSVPAREETLKKWKDTSAETKIQILKEELARGAEPGEVARVAREAGLNEFADSIEKKQQH